MSRRASLPGAAELFRSTSAAGTRTEAGPPAPAETRAPAESGGAAAVAPTSMRAGRRSPSGREKHDEKITVYCSPAELLDLETARLRLRAEHGISVDRGRIVREAIALALADMDARGAESALAQRLHEA